MMGYFILFLLQGICYSSSIEKVPTIQKLNGDYHNSMSDGIMQKYIHGRQSIILNQGKMLWRLKFMGV